MEETWRERRRTPTKKEWRRKPQTPVQAYGVKEEGITSSVFPVEILVDILSRLPAKSILRFRCVCRYFCNKLFTDPIFLKIHRNRMNETGKFNIMSLTNLKCTLPLKKSLSVLVFEGHESVEIDYPFKSSYSPEYNHSYGSCNGLILMTNPKRTYKPSLCLWNPSTKQSKEVVIPKDKYKTGCNYRVEYGLGYDDTNDDYKIFKISQRVPHGFTGECETDDDCDGHSVPGCEVQVYTLSSNSWKFLPNIRYKINSQNKGNAIFVNGALHWIARREWHRWNYKKSICVIAFGTRDLKFCEVPLTPQVIDGICNYTNHRGKALGVIGGCLCLVLHGDHHIEVWVMKDYGVGESWCKGFVIQGIIEGPIHNLKLLWEFKNGEVLFLAATDSNYLEAHYFVVCDPMHNKYRLTNKHLMGEYGNVEACVHSLVLFNHSTSSEHGSRTPVMPGNSRRSRWRSEGDESKKRIRRHQKNKNHYYY